MTDIGKNTYQEIMSQPTIWEAALRIFQEQQQQFMTFWRQGEFRQVIFTGCGSTYYLSIMAARLFQQLTHIPSSALPASELVFSASDYLKPSNTLLVAVSRSGTTSETLKAVDIFRETANGSILTVTCYSESPLSEKSDFTLAIDEAREESIAQTRSFSSMALMTQLIAASIANQDVQSANQLPTICHQLLNDQHALAQQFGEDEHISRFFFLGSSALYGIASEAMLKMKEMSLSYSEVYHTLEFRHGPMSMVNEKSLVIGLVNQASAIHEIAVLDEMQNRGAQIFALGNQVIPFTHAVNLPDDLPSWCYPVLYLPLLQLIGYYRALLNGQNPDKPHNLDAVVSLANL
jgi:glucosamine--fructose-6-phosphate aminotransferase (isomerizing)